MTRILHMPYYLNRKQIHPPASGIPTTRIKHASSCAPDDWFKQFGPANNKGWKSNTYECANDASGRQRGSRKEGNRSIVCRKVPMPNQPPRSLCSFLQEVTVRKQTRFAQLRNPSTVPPVHSSDCQWTCTSRFYINRMDFDQLSCDVRYWKSKNRISLKVLHFLCRHSGELFSHDEGIVLWTAERHLDPRGDPRGRSRTEKNGQGLKHMQNKAFFFAPFIDSKSKPITRY